MNPARNYPCYSSFHAQGIASLALACSIALSVFVAGCTSNPSSSTSPPLQSVMVSVSSSSSSVLLGNTQQFTDAVTGTSNTAVTWSVNGISGGNSTVGTISSVGLYTAPQDLPNTACEKVTATSEADSSASGSASITITSDISVAVAANPPNPQSLSPGTTLTLSATITSAGHPDAAVTWSVNNVPNGNTSVGNITTTGPGTATYTAPATPPNPDTITPSVLLQRASPTHRSPLRRTLSFRLYRSPSSRSVPQLLRQVQF